MIALGSSLHALLLKLHNSIKSTLNSHFQSPPAHKSWICYRDSHSPGMIPIPWGSQGSFAGRSSEIPRLEQRRFRREELPGKGGGETPPRAEKSAPATEFPANPKRWKLVSMPWKGSPFHPLIRRTGIILISQHWVMLILALAVFWFHRMSCRKEIFKFFSPLSTSCLSFPWDFQGWILLGETLPLCGRTKILPTRALLSSTFPIFLLFPPF